jgi:hypothetical protein
MMPYFGEDGPHAAMSLLPRRRVVPPAEPPLDGPPTANRVERADSLLRGRLDERVFGPLYTVAPELVLKPRHWCGGCGAQWNGEPACWNCGGPG